MTAAVLVSLLLGGPAVRLSDQPKPLTLAEAIQSAERHSPVLAGVIAEFDAARAGARGAKSQLLPQVSANGFASTGNNSAVMSTSPADGPPVWMVVPTGNFSDANLALMMPLFAPGIQATAKAAIWQAEAAEGELDEARAELALQVTEAYDRVLLKRQIILAENAKLTAAKELVRTTQAMFDAGKGIEASVQRSQAELSQAERSLTTAGNDEAKATLDLEATMGIDMSSVIDPSDSLVQTPVTTTLAGCLAKARELRGALRAERARNRAAGLDVRAAQGEGMPQLYGSVMGDATNRRAMGGVSAGLTLTLPLFDGGRASADVARTRAMKAKAESAVRLAELMVEKEVREAWLDVLSAHSNAVSARSSVQSAQAAYDVTALRVAAGKAILVEQLDALDALVRAKSDLAQSTFDQAVALAKLNRAVGTQP